MNKKILAAKITLITSIMASSLMIPTVQAGVPTVDFPTFSTNLLEDFEQIKHTVSQIDQYEQQIKQYKQQLRDASHGQFEWQKSKQIIQNLIDATDSLDKYKNQVGSLDAYLGKFHDAPYYENSPCFRANSNGCTTAERNKIEQSRNLGSESTRVSNQGVLRGLYQQQQNLKNDSLKLDHLQNSSVGADGQRATLDFANQFASNQSYQLLQIRALLIAQQTALATKAQADENKEAIQNAAHKKFWSTDNAPIHTQNEVFKFDRPPQ